MDPNAGEANQDELLVEGNRMKRAVFLVSLLVLGCGRRDVDPGEDLRKPSPTRQEHVGWVIQKKGVTAKELRDFQRRFHADIRLIHLNEGLFEVRGTNFEPFPKEVIEHEFVGASIAKNTYFEHLDQSKNIQITVDGCKTGQKPPLALVEPVTHAQDLQQTQMVKLGTGPVIVSGGRSRPRIGKTLKNSIFVVVGPKVSKFSLLELRSDTLEFDPDVPGAYEILYTVQDERGVCSTTSFSFGVMYNKVPVYGGAQPRRALVPADLKIFKYLNVVNAPSAWVSAEGKGASIAIVDSGLNYNHPDLANNILLNPNEIPDNHIDDDKNGFVDDVVGVDLVNQSNLPMDDSDHGTHVSGLAASSVNGVAPRASLLGVKVINAMGGGDAATIAGGIMYAVDRKVDVINLSLGADGIIFEKTLKKAIDYAEAKGVLVVVAAGNETTNIDQKKLYPASYKNKNIVTVAASTYGGDLTQYSNWGQESVDLAAPGGSYEVDGSGIISTSYFPTVSFYLEMAGTSMATPIVAGAAAVLKSARASLSANEIRTLLLKNVSLKPQLKGKMQSEGVLDLGKAVKDALSFSQVKPVALPARISN